jgi:hypothetical protein
MLTFKWRPAKMGEAKDMLLHELLAENDRGKRRTIADVLEVLRTNANFEQGDVAKVRIGMLRLPSDQSVGLVLVSFDSTVHQKTFLVSLPTAVSFRARRESKAQPEEFEISRLDGATINSEGHVQLSDGTQIRGAEVIPTLLPYNITPLDWAIIRQTVAELGIEEECRYDPGQLVRRTWGANPFHGGIDCSKLSGRRAPLLKTIQARIEDDEPNFRTVSLQKIADTLRKFNMRVPTSRASSRARPARARN